MRHQSTSAPLGIIQQVYPRPRQPPNTRVSPHRGTPQAVPLHEYSNEIHPTVTDRRGRMQDPHQNQRARGEGSGRRRLNSASLSVGGDKQKVGLLVRSTDPALVVGNQRLLDTCFGFTKYSFSSRTILRFRAPKLRPVPELDFLRYQGWGRVSRFQYDRHGSTKSAEPQVWVKR